MQIELCIKNDCTWFRQWDIGYNKDLNSTISGVASIEAMRQLPH